MREIATRYALGAVFALFAIAFTHVGSVFAVIPAVVSVYMLGSLFLDVWRKNV